MQKYLKILLIALIITIAAPQITFASWYNPFSWNWNIWSWFKSPTTQIQNYPRPIGGDKDAHGCLIGGGYSWCEVKQKCLRQWEEKCCVPEGVSIGAPRNAEDLCCEGLTKQPTSQSGTIGICVNPIKSDLSGMIVKGEEYYNDNSSYKGFCTSGKASNLIKDIKTLTTPTNFSCYDSNNSWSASSKLADSSYFCVDSRGIEKIETTKPTSTSCSLN